MLLAGMGEGYIRRHTYAGAAWYGPPEHERLEKFRAEGVEVRAYDPLIDTVNQTAEAGLDGVTDIESSLQLMPHSGVENSDGG